MNIDTKGNYKLYWGNMPLPQGAEALGVADGGALLLLLTGVYVRGNAGSVASLNQSVVKKLLGLEKRGGIRIGAGRPTTNRSPITRQVSAEEKIAVDNLLLELRK